MIRIFLCYLFVLFFSVYAYRRWFISLCAAILMMAVLEHPDMPKSIGGVQGLNPWNILMANVMMAWWVDKNRFDRRLDLPRQMSRMLLMFICVILISALRLLSDPGLLALEMTTGAMVSEYIINCLKWMLPFLLMFDGCRDERSMRIGMAAILGLYLLLAIQTIRWMPLGMIVSGDDLSARASKITQNEIGYNRVTLSMMLAGASWAMMVTIALFRGWRARTAIVLGAAALMLGQALTGGRTGYATWVAVGLVIGVIRWRKLMVLIPILITLVVTFVPAVRERMLHGIVGTETGEIDEYAVMSGRNIAWPRVIDAIQEAPVWGYGRQAMTTTGIREGLWVELEESFPHPHNAYLEAALDNGIVGLAVIIGFFAVIVRAAYQLFRDRDDPLACVIGGVCFSLVLALLIGSMGGQTFYPREGSVGMWAAIGIMVRMKVQQQQRCRDEHGAAESFAGAEASPEYEYAPAPERPLAS